MIEFMIIGIGLVIAYLLYDILGELCAIRSELEDIDFQTYGDCLFFKEEEGEKAM